MQTIVQKYGGSSVSTTKKIEKVAKSIIEKKKQGHNMVVVVSAMGNTTNKLIKLSLEVSKKPDKRELDALIATGEMVSSSLLAIKLKDLGFDAISLNAFQINLKTNGIYGKSSISDIDEDIIHSQLNKGKIVIIAGFQGISDDNEITTLGRGGSDTSAVALSVKLNAKCEIYTDVDGIYKVDPRLYKEAKKLDEISYEEMLELASLGAGIMHSRAVELGQKYNKEIYVGLSCSNTKGTYITEGLDMEKRAVSGIAVSDDDIAINIENIDYDINLIAKIFTNIAKEKINVDMISQTMPFNNKINISFTVPKSDTNDILKLLESFILFDNINVDENITKFSVVGMGMKDSSGIAARLFEIFKDNNIEIKMITTSEIRITCAIDSKYKEVAISNVAKFFDL